MIRLDIQQLQANLPRCLDQVAGGETIVVCKDNQPFAEIRPVAPGQQTPRPMGLAHGMIDVKSSFFEPLPDDVIAAFEGNQG